MTITEFYYSKKPSSSQLKNLHAKRISVQTSATWPSSSRSRVALTSIANLDGLDQKTAQAYKGGSLTSIERKYLQVYGFLSWMDQGKLPEGCKEINKRL